VRSRNQSKGEQVKPTASDTHAIAVLVLLCIVAVTLLFNSIALLVYVF